METNVKEFADLQLQPMPELGHKTFLLEVDCNGQKVTDWAYEYKGKIEKMLEQQGMLLIRGLNIMSSKQFGQILTTLFGQELANYDYRSTPRTELKGNIYTATEYPPSEVIQQHNESAYSNRWASKLGFLCMLPAASGGATPIADSRIVYQRIPKEIREKFEKKKLKYVRNYGSIDLPWTEVFQTTDRHVVESYCKENMLDFEWKENDGLRTSQTNEASQIHPRTGESVWFNQAHMFHISALDLEVRNSMLSVYGEHDLPRNVYYGDGSAIEEEALDLIRDIYEEEKAWFTWQAKDLMLLDNMLFTHGRMPFTGDRKVLVGMA